MTNCGHRAAIRNESSLIIGVVSALATVITHGAIARARLGRSARGPANRPRPAAVG